MDEQLTSAEVSKRRITTQLKGAVKALQAAHVRDHSSVVYRFDFYDLIHSQWRARIWCDMGWGEGGTKLGMN